MRNGLLRITSIVFLTILCVLLVSCGEKEMAEEELIKAAFTAAECYEQLDNDKPDVKAMLGCLERASYAASDILSEYGFVNDDIIRRFFEEKEENLDFVRVYHDGGLMYTRIYEDETGWKCGNVRLKRNGGKTELSYYECFSITKLELSEKGWLIYTCDIPDNTASSDHDGFIEPTTMLRLEKQNEMCREFEEKYISPIGYNFNELFTTDWSTGKMEAVSFNDLYLSLYKLDTGAYVSYFNNPYPVVEGSPFSLVPAEEFESLIRKYIDVDADSIKAASNYDEGSDAYPVRIDGPHDGLAKIPVPEVIDVTKNDDETYTLLVDALFVEYATDCAFSHELIVRPEEGGGFKYVSNRVLPSENNIFLERNT